MAWLVFLGSSRAKDKLERTKKQAWERDWPPWEAIREKQAAGKLETGGVNPGSM